MTDDKPRLTKEQRDLFASIDDYRIGNLLHDLELVERQRDEAREIEAHYEEALEIAREAAHCKVDTQYFDWSCLIEWLERRP